MPRALFLGIKQTSVIQKIVDNNNQILKITISTNARKSLVPGLLTLRLP